MTQFRIDDPWDERPWRDTSQLGRLDANGVQWWACDPYPTWYRWEGQQLLTDPVDWADVSAE